MSEIAQGIKVYYENKKEVRNIVFFPDDTYRYYDTGAMIFEIISEEASYMLITKALNMIKVFPDYSVEMTVDSITDGFKWLYGTIENDDLPVATELFRSSFNEAIEQVLERMKTEDSSKAVGEFFLECYDEYLDNIFAFIDFLEAIAADASGVADEKQTEIARLFADSSENLMAVYSKKCSVRHEKGAVSVETHQITNLLQLLTFEYCRLKKENKLLKQCDNCGRIFIPQHRSDSIYCGAVSPQNPEKTCSEIGAQLKRQKKRSENPKEREHHNTVCKTYNYMRRAIERGDSDDTVEYCRRKLDNEYKKYNMEKEGASYDERTE